MKLLPHLPAYETQDVRATTIALSGAGLFAGIILSLVAVAGILYWLRPADNTAPTIETRQLRAGPRLEVNPDQDAQRLQRIALQRLQDYGWADRRRGQARIPIERAMQLLAKQGWPDSDAGGAKP
jgi:hypothetical protein